MILTDLSRKNLIHPPKWLPQNTVMLMIMGSQAYGVNNDDSDQDIYGVCIPPKELVFPHLAGEIPGFGTQIQRFEVWQEHHIQNPDKKVEHDFSVYGIVKYLQLCMDNNPNMIDSLNVPRNCIIHSTAVGEMIREKRRMFLHKGAWHKFKGYAYSALNKLRGKTMIREFLELTQKYQLPLDVSLKDVENEIKKRETARARTSSSS